jgi:hypothetical protein
MTLSVGLEKTKGERMLHHSKKQKQKQNSSTKSMDVFEE